MIIWFCKSYIQLLCRYNSTAVLSQTPEIGNLKINRSTKNISLEDCLQETVVTFFWKCNSFVDNFVEILNPCEIIRGNSKPTEIYQNAHASCPLYVIVTRSFVYCLIMGSMTETNLLKKMNHYSKHRCYLQFFTWRILHGCKIFDIFVYVSNKKHSWTSKKNIVWSHSPQQTICLFS